MTTQELINKLAPLAVGLRSPELLIYDAKTGQEFTIERVYLADTIDQTVIDIRPTGFTVVS